MRAFILFLCIMGCMSKGFCQKKIIDTSAFQTWTSLDSSMLLSKDGKYLAYTIRNQPLGNHTVVLRSTKNDWKREFPGLSLNYYFSQRDKWFFCQEKGDSLCFVKLGKDKVKWITGVRSFQIFPGDKRDWLIYKKSDSGTIVILDLRSGKEQSISGVSGYTVYDNNIKNLILFVKDSSLKAASWVMKRFDVDKNTSSVLYSGKIAAIVHDSHNEGQYAFISSDEGGGKSLWYIKKGMDIPKCLIKSGSLADTSLLLSGNLPVFNKDGSRIFVTLQEKSLPNANATGVKVDVWGYKDRELQEYQLKEAQYVRSYLAVVSIEGNKFAKLEDDESKLYNGDKLQSHGKFCILREGWGSDFWWKDDDRSSIYLYTLQDGSRVMLKHKLHYDDGFENLGFYLSPGEKYVIYFDPVSGNYFSYEIANGISRDITSAARISWKEDFNNGVADPELGSPVGIAGWLPNDTAILIYDRFDIWKVDPSGASPPENITRGIGRLNHTQLRIMDGGNQLTIFPKQKLLLNAFDTVSQYSGFYSLTIGKKDGPVRLTMGPYRYRKPIKADKSNRWVVVRESAVEAPNVFVTKDLIRFHSMSDIAPEKDYNWFRTELKEWTMTNGRKSQGVLFKPENFDSTKKYPLLLNFYEKLSNTLYQYREPGLSTGNINIPYFVSRGYLVFLPDIYYEKGEMPGESSLNSVVSAARHLSLNPWIDSTKMAIQGHGLGGSETNYLITHTHLFAAAAESAGICDMISAYGSLLANGSSRQYMFELGNLRSRATLWQDQPLYLRNSPILQADRVTTPLLMLHNKNDMEVPFAQGVELFSGLRRLGKKAWMLQYDKAGHVLSGPEAMDYTIRMEQFFNHYLKGSLPPRWMTEGIPARQKGFEKKYELDASGKQP